MFALRHSYLKDGLVRLCIAPIGKSLWSQAKRGIKIGYITAVYPHTVCVAAMGGGSFTFRRHDIHVLYP